jgi:hypothetical protein
MKTYYTLIGIDPSSNTGEYDIVFGDFSREVVEDEKQDEKDSGSYQYLRIICTSSNQKDIDAKVAEININGRNRQQGVN